MSLLRRWFDPIRSSWFYQKPSRQAVLPTENGLSIYLRLDDVYSYLAVQQLSQLDEILSDELKPLKIIISHTASEPPNSMTHEEWQHYCLNDAKILANQHRFAFDEFPEIPSPESLKQAAVILKRTPLQGQNFLHLLEDIFHMLWQQQYGKLRTLHAMAVKHQVPQHFPERIFTDEPVRAAYFEFGGRKYHAVDDLLRLTRRLKQQKLLTGNPIFLINHIEWREHLINDAEALNEIQALHPELDVFIALEDPMSWLLLAYIKEELADYYDIQLKVYPLSYRGRCLTGAWQHVCLNVPRLLLHLFADLQKKVRLGWQSFSIVCRKISNLIQFSLFCRLFGRKEKIYLSRSISNNYSSNWVLSS
ncbi:hypothetical protein ACINIS123_1149 [Acinetobacter baumannii IS-123]|nr:hypothetical protein ACINIS123_1149 [Acinetobacter baumannii IS-123]